MSNINANMLARESEIQSSDNGSVMDTINKVYIYNPNYQNGDVMEKDKQGKFRVKKPGGEEIFIDSFDFGLIDLAKITSGKVVYKDEFGDSIYDSENKPASDYYYTNEYFPMSRGDSIVGLRKMKGGKDSAIYLKKKDLSMILRLPKINGTKNDFSIVKTKQDGSTYRTSVVTESHVIYGVFTSGELKGEYFIFYPKDNMIGFNYSKGQYVQPLEGTLTRILEDQLKEWNKIRKENKMSELRNLPYSLIDLNMSTYSKEVMSKEFNIGKFKFKQFTGVERDNTQDLEYIKEFRNQYFEERFDGFKTPLNVIYIDKYGKEYSQYPNEKSITIVDCKFEHDFRYDISGGDQLELSQGVAGNIEAPKKKPQVTDGMTIDDVNEALGLGPDETTPF